MTKFALHGTGLTRQYGGFKALDDVSITLRPGEIRGLIGSNGAGKSTLMDALCGRGEVTGNVHLFGQDISKLSERKRRRAGLARSFQKTNIFPELTVMQQIRLAAQAFDADNSAEILEALTLTHAVHTRASDLAYGDQRRLDLALALIGRPKVLLLDEPAAGLTVKESIVLANILRELAERWKVTVLIVEHDMEVIFSICSYLTVLHLGKILTEGTPAQIKNNPEVVKAYLGSTVI
jgi:branched-chain amino acid transport system ATP-binding protein